MKRLLVCCLTTAGTAAVWANDVYSGVVSSTGTVQNFAPLAAVDNGQRLKHPLSRGTVAVPKRVAISATRSGAEPPLAGLRLEVPVYERLVESGAPAGPISTSAKTVDFNVDLGMYNGRPRVPTPRYDANGQISQADQDGDPAIMRDPSGRIRQVPQVSVGMNVRF